jgi:hypothetical protein
MLHAYRIASCRRDQSHWPPAHGSRSRPFPNIPDSIVGFPLLSHTAFCVGDATQCPPEIGRAMGCVSSKAAADVPAQILRPEAPAPDACNAAPLLVETQMGPMLGWQKGNDAPDSPRATTSAWFDRPKDLKQHVLEEPPCGRKFDEYLAAVVDVAKRSYEKRIMLGDKNMIERLAKALECEMPSTVKAAARALKMLSFCHPNHECDFDLVCLSR